MFKQTILVIVALSALLLCTSVRAQQPPDGGPGGGGPPGGQGMQQFFQQMMQNMQDKGIDPQQFFQQMQNGADPADIQKQMMDQGIIDQKMIDQMKTSLSSATLDRIKTELGVTDDEWKVLQPAVQKVIDAQNDVSQQSQTGGRPGGGMMGGLFADQTSELSVAKKKLHLAIVDPATSPEIFTSRLSDFRDAYKKAKNKLSDAQTELTALLSVRQEAILANAGLLP